MRFGKPRGSRGSAGLSLTRTLWHSLESLPSQEQIERLITREVARAERNGLHFSLALFRVKKGRRLGLNEKRLALTLLRRVRVTDEVGWFNDEYLCAILPDTSARGAQVFADSVCDLVGKKGPRPISVVYSFPLDGSEPKPKSTTPPGGGRNRRGESLRMGRSAGSSDLRVGLGDLVGQDEEVPSNNSNGHRPHHGKGGMSPNGRDTHSQGMNFASNDDAEEFVEEEEEGTVAVLERQPRVTFQTELETEVSPAEFESKTEVLPIHDLLVQPMPWWKRAIDICAASGAILAASPVLIGAALAIKLTSPGPVVFTQRRSGLGGKPFTIYKFRTMVVDAEAKKKELRRQSEQDGPAFKMLRDPRITRIGAFLRKTSIDELPQLFNILKGDMSLVGPRPLPIDEQSAAETWQQRRLHVTPGLTCIWQIEGRSRVTFAEWVRMDVAYMRRRTILHDLAILLRTVPAVLLRRGAR